ncbi:hypothetical protein G5C60_37100 [Streptomyces sp. HC44]|uniref:Uncharacterized protein n=1 Tax=Streptomyces scabichelini TaxID=2711217 RepID=A0A6G4VH18_9ACTN|nr:hypothetical protein [Streptomyces scabichelini]NGO13073.1 hypothetical protein [Streptomyces scabichelini]
MAEAPDSMAIVAADPETGAYTQHYFDSRGVIRVYAMTFADGVWRLLRETPDFDFTCRRSHGGRAWTAADVDEASGPTLYRAVADEHSILAKDGRKR